MIEYNTEKQINSFENTVKDVAYSFAQDGVSITLKESSSAVIKEIIKEQNENDKLGCIEELNNKAWDLGKYLEEKKEDLLSEVEKYFVEKKDELKEIQIDLTNTQFLSKQERTDNGTASLFVLDVSVTFVNTSNDGMDISLAISEGNDSGPAVVRVN